MQTYIINKLSYLVLFFLWTNIPGSIAQVGNQQMKSLVPDVQRQQLTNRTYIFSRAQFIYSLGDRNYLHHWVDRPLFIWPKEDTRKPKAALMSLASYNSTQNIVQDYGLDGLAFFPQTTKRALFSQYSKNTKTSKTHLLYELLSDKRPLNEAQAVSLALSDPNSFRINGKPVLTSYRADGVSILQWQITLTQLHRKYGNTFLFLPDIYYFAGKSLNFWKDKFYQNKITQEDVDNIKQYFRSWLLICDGLYFASVAMCTTPDRKFDSGFYKNFVIRLIKSVLAEPAFKNKLFGLSAVVGHENCTRFGYTLSSDGTKTLRKSFEVAINAHPEIINIPEWDEQNENTSLRPTVYNGLSSMRIMRYYTSKIKGLSLRPLPEDNTQIPNLIISSRKTITLGEKLEVELLNVPDDNQSTTYTAILELEDLSGNVVYHSPSFTFHTNEMEDHTVSLPSEDFAKYPVLRPKIILQANNKTTTIENGLHYIELRATWNWDYKWVKQAIRDLIHPTKVELNIGQPDADGMRTVQATFDAHEPLAYVEILDDDDVAYSYAPDAHTHESPDQVVLKFSWIAMGGYAQRQRLHGNITLNHATGHWIVPANTLVNTSNIKGMTLSLEGLGAFRSRRQWISLAIPKSDINKASLAINLPGLFKGNIPVKDILAREIYGIPGPRGFNLVISRQVTQGEIPDNLDLNKVQFSVPVKPALNGSIICLQAIGISGHEYRSKPVLLLTPSSASQTTTVYSDTKNAPISLKINKNRIPDIQYQFNPEHGSVLMPGGAGRPFRAILGGYFAQATGRGGGGGGDDIPFVNPRDYPSNTQKSAPEWVKTENGDYALSFDGKGTFISIPQGVIPPRSAFTIDMDIKPETIQGKQIIIANRNYYPGSLTVYMENGEIKFDYRGRNTHKSSQSTGLQLPAQAWSHLTIKYDLQNLHIFVNDRRGKIFPVKGPGLYTTASVVGGFGNFWFKGLIKNLHIKHYLN